MRPLLTILIKLRGYSVNYNDMTANRIDVVELACEEYSQEVLGFSNVIAKVADAFRASSRRSILTEVDESYYDPEGDILIREHSYTKTAKSSIDEPPEVELKDLPPHLEYAFLEDNNKFPVIIAKDLSVDEKTASHKEDYEPAVQHQRRANPKIHDVIKKEVEKLPDAGLIYPISDWSLEKCLNRVKEHNLALNWEKSHFMVKEGIVLGHKISKKGIEVDKAKIDVIAKLPHPTTVKGIRSFLGHAGFYRRFIKDFSKISRPMTHLLEKNTPFIFSEECI
ncbi:hypothetical protein Tco_0925675 [Tanacetum coccineum]|uniref:Reverse transcriptase domain-containing protein n=1 Tax=Tanacetum coccineum TaxID=301880 RepID=A0ABQ5D7J1_9ASTR